MKGVWAIFEHVPLSDVLIRVEAGIIHFISLIFSSSLLNQHDIGLRLTKSLEEREKLKEASEVCRRVLSVVHELRSDSIRSSLSSLSLLESEILLTKGFNFILTSFT